MKPLTVGLYVFGYWVLGIALVFHSPFSYIIGAFCIVGGILNEQLPQGLLKFLGEAFGEKPSLNEKKEGEKEDG